MKLALTAGGTAGHIQPALAVCDALRARPGLAVDVRFFGPEDRGERTRIEARNIRFEAVPAGAIRGRGPLSLGRSMLRLGRGSAVALRKLRAFGPDAVFSTGGYGSFPASLAARALRRPLVVFLPDVSPGWAVRAEKRLATRIATTTEAALAFLPSKKTAVTGYPVRPAFFAQTREQARAALGLAADEKVLLVGTSSQGSKVINAAVFKSLRDLVEVMTVFHITGADDYDEAAGFDSVLGGLSARYHPAKFREDLPALMQAADLAVARAGASVLGELPAAALPAILVPGTYAGGHQAANAEWLAGQGAAVVLEEPELPGLAERVLNLIEDVPRLAAMRAASAALAKPRAADAIADLLLEVAKR
ncbi:MAG: UDP-N-acetylglucosamine--N-acetylmuramyl-(pentapeptide) pyrophosphoryl-undecaprenol N-acetylglucosamine transferase [Chloroflexi bacterium]|nr:UDP-N-acetylglucosamine--N-acetylmuramyl-(pentapeptide) pyrophosphoryl-undecaprenol N-acetylglucosamine transferase [Chloroflexota bacterium]